MRKYGARLLALGLCLCMLLVMVPCVSADTGDEVRAAKKIISVVYDDSGSMAGDRWVYANYAMQALTALLNTQDELYITYMSDPYTARSIPLSDIEGAVTGIRDWRQSSGTPGASLDTAKTKLDGISETDTSTQFWLIVLTDGEIDMLDTIQSRLNSYKGSVMSNGSTMNIVYLAMGPGAIPAGDDKAHGLYTYDAATPAEITKTMSSIANLISSRLDADDVKQVDDRTISFRSELPLYSIAVLTQQSSASVTGAKSQEETLEISRNIALDSKEPFVNTLTTLFGNAAVITRSDGTGANKVIQAGTYTVTFSEPVSVNDLVIQYEPAIGIRMVAKRDGIEITDTSALAAGDTVDIELIPVIPGTDQQISDSSLPKGISWKIEYIIDGTVMASKDGQKLTGVTLVPGDNTIRGTMQIPGFAPSVTDIYFAVSEIILDLGILTDQPDPLKYDRSGNILEGSGPVTFHITNEGIPLTKDQQKDLGIKLKVDSIVCDSSNVKRFPNGGWTECKYSLKQNDDGSYTLLPKTVAALLPAFAVKAGEYTVTVSITTEPGITAVGRFTLVAQLKDWWQIGIILVILLLLIYLIRILTKNKFKNQKVSCYRYELHSYDNGGDALGRLGSVTLSPLKGILRWKDSETQFLGLTLRAGQHGTVLVTGESIAKNYAYCTTSDLDPESRLSRIIRYMDKTRAETGGRKIVPNLADIPLSEHQVLYLRSTESDKIVKALEITG